MAASSPTPLLSLLILASVTVPAAAETACPMKVEAPWARASVGTGSAAAYMTIVNPGGADRVIGIATPRATMAMLHGQSTVDGVSRMQNLAGLELPAGGSVGLAPGGTHVMLMQLDRPLRAGDRFPLTVEFASGARCLVEVPVGPLGAMGPPAGQ